jgi:hypothetical protein
LLYVPLALRGRFIRASHFDLGNPHESITIGGSRAPTFTPGDEVSYFAESAFVVSDGDLSKLNSPGARMRRTRTGTSTPIARR